MIQPLPFNCSSILALIFLSNILLTLPSQANAKETQSVRLQKFNELMSLNDRLKESRVSLEELNRSGLESLEYMKKKANKLSDTGFLTGELMSTCLEFEKELITRIQETLDIQEKVINFSEIVIKKNDDEVDEKFVHLIDEYMESVDALIIEDESFVELAKETLDFIENSIINDRGFSVYFDIARELEAKLIPVAEKLSQAIDDKNQHQISKLKREAYKLITQANEKIEANRSIIEKVVPDLKLLDHEDTLDGFLNPKDFEKEAC